MFLLFSSFFCSVLPAPLIHCRYSVACISFLMKIKNDFKYLNMTINSQLFICSNFFFNLGRFLSHRANISSPDRPLYKMLEVMGLVCSRAKQHRSNGFQLHGVLKSWALTYPVIIFFPCS